MDKTKFKTKTKPKPLSDCISLKGKTSIITGAASGIGKAISYRFAEAGSNLILLDIDEKGLSNTLDLIKDFTNLKKTYIIDLSRKEKIDNFWNNSFNSQDSRLPDILINNAGIYPFKKYLSIDENFYAKTLEINLNSVFWMCQNFIKKREKEGGIIINVSSIEAVVPFKEDMAHYSISKSGVIALTRALSRDYGKKGFRINGVMPGAIKTPGTMSLFKSALLKFQLDLIKTGIEFKSRLPAGRWGEADEVAKAVLFLASDLASYIHGVMLPVDGGFLSS